MTGIVRCPSFLSFGAVAPINYLYIKALAISIHNAQFFFDNCELCIY